MTLPVCGDIFDPTLCDSYFVAAKTGQQVDYYLFKRLSKLRCDFDTFAKMQLELNKDNSTQFQNIKTLIETANNAIKVLDGEIEKLKEADNNFEVRLTEQSKLINSSIVDFKQQLFNFNDLLNILTSSNTNILNEIQEIKNNIDLDKLNEVIKTYDEIYNKLDSEIAKQFAPIKAEFNVLAQRVTNLENAYKTDLASIENDFNSALAALQQQVDTSLNNQNAEINNFKSIINNTIEQYRLFFNNKIDALEKKVDSNDLANENEIKRVEKESKDRDDSLNDKINSEVTQLNTTIGKVESESKQRDTDIESAYKIADSNLNAYIGNVANEANTAINMVHDRVKVLEDDEANKWKAINNSVSVANNAFVVASGLSDRIDSNTNKINANKTSQDVVNSTLSKNIEQNSSNHSKLVKHVIASDRIIRQFSVGQTPETVTVGDLTLVFGSAINTALTVSFPTTLYGYYNSTTLVANNSQVVAIVVANSSRSTLQIYSKDNSYIKPKFVEIVYNSTTQTFIITVTNQSTTADYQVTDY